MTSRLTLATFAALAGLSLAASACSEAAETEALSRTLGSTERAIMGQSQPAARVAKRDCQSGVLGSLPASWRGPESLTAGPLTIGGLRAFGPRLTAEDLKPVKPGRFQAIKTLTSVEAGRTAILVVGRESVPTARLFFVGENDPAGLYALKEGTRAVRLEACPDRRTQFSGAMILAGVQCLRLDVYTVKPTRRYRRMVPIGQGASCEREG